MLWRSFPALLILFGITTCAPAAPREPSAATPTDGGLRSATVDARAPVALVAPDAAPASTAVDAGPPTCGTVTCAAGEFCEERYKGHAVDDRGRPLEKYRCVPLPKACRSQPSCECVVRHVSATNCREAGGLVHTDDSPRRSRRR